ncbi:hypothetical protein YT1_0261 [Rhodococcus ruber]|nr:hypothetical protein YT1_0261 [Rhodococcus ruber]
MMALAHVPSTTSQSDMVTAVFRTIFVQSDPDQLAADSPRSVL